MKKLHFLLTIAALLAFFSVEAQDQIFKKNGEIIDARISLVNTDIIVFKKFDNPDGPEYSIPKGDVARIKYKNGSQDIFEENNDMIGVEKGKEAPKMSTEVVKKRNIVAFAPIVFTEHGYGIGANWEHNLDKSGWVTFNFPVIVTWNSGGQPGTSRDALFYAMPGIKFYPTLNSGSKGKFSIGPSLVVGLGTGVPSGSNYYPVDPTPHQNHVMMGAMAMIGDNFFVTEHAYLGLDFGLGYSYLNQYNGVNDATAVLTEFSLKFGYRYSRKVAHKGAK